MATEKVSNRFDQFGFRRYWCGETEPGINDHLSRGIRNKRGEKDSPLPRPALLASPAVRTGSALARRSGKHPERPAHLRKSPPPPSTGPVRRIVVGFRIATRERGGGGVRLDAGEEGGHNKRLAQTVPCARSEPRHRPVVWCAQVSRRNARIGENSAQTCALGM